MLFRTDDPVYDFVRHDWKQSRSLERLPFCERCCNRIEQEWAVCIDGVWYCDDCIEFYRKEIEVE
jgi:late competence protein required for DNA uptake (superfamily II DNA/RNA helicase)